MLNDTGKSYGKNLFRDSIKGLAERYYEDYVNELGIEEKLITPRDIPLRVVDEIMDVGGFDEFLKYTPDTTEDTLSQDILEFVNENYDSDYFVVKIERLLDEDVIRQNLSEELLKFLENAEGIADVSRSYWIDRISKVNQLKDLAKYATEDGVYEFVEQYAADYQEAAN